MLGALTHQELVPEGKDLRVERSSGAESLPQRKEQRENDREHVVCNVSGCSSKFNWLNQNGVFGRSRWDKRGNGGTRNEVGETI